MRRAAVEPQRAKAAAFDEAVQLWAEHPEQGDGPAVDAWTSHYEAFVDAHGLDAVAVVVESIRRGLADPPWTP